MIERGDIVLLDFPFTDGKQSKVRPALVIQNDADNRRLKKTIVAMITGNLQRANEPTHMLIDPATSDQSSGLSGPSLAAFVNLFTVDQAAMLRRLGRLDATRLDHVDRCLRAALDL